MVVAKEGALQLDHAAWETLRGMVKSEVQSYSNRLLESLEANRAQLHSRLDEFHGQLVSVDKEHNTIYQTLDDRQGNSENQLANLSVDVHKCGATARGELRRACIEIEGKITALANRDDSEKREMDRKIDRECKAIREQHRETTLEIMAKMQELQQQVINDRAERQATQTRCMHYTDRQIAAALASAELEARFQHVRDLVGALDLKLQRVESSMRADLKCYSDELHAVVTARINDLIATGNQRHAEMEAKMQQCSAVATQAAASADKAVRLVDESLHEKVHKASRALINQIEEAARRSQQAGHADEQATEQAMRHKVKHNEELEAGFYGLVAREALGTELRVLVDRATRRMQIISDDLAQRSSSIQEHITAAEERLNDSLQYAEMRATQLEAKTRASSDLGVSLTLVG